MDAFRQIARIGDGHAIGVEGLFAPALPDAGKGQEIALVGLEEPCSLAAGLCCHSVLARGRHQAAPAAEGRTVGGLRCIVSAMALMME